MDVMWRAAKDLMCRASVGIGFTLIFGLTQSASVLSRDLQDHRDHPLVKRFPGSAIVQYEKRNAAPFAVPIGRLVRWDYAQDLPDFDGKKIDLEGEVTRITYLIQRRVSAAEVFHSFERELTASGFKILFEAEGPEFGRSQGNLYHDIQGQLLEYSPRAAHFLSAKLDSAPVTAYVSLYATEYEMGATSVKVRPGEVVLQLDVIEVPPTSDKLVVVSASDISKGLETSGRVAVYGILFDSNKADVKPQSRPALDEIAKYLRSVQNAKLDVVGHTDNVGSYDSNLDLSRARAAAVVGTLVKEYDINPQRLRPSGVGFLAPIASNSTDAGRATNRRVELLPQ
jgi:OmpA-OmpF porin, OOP family